MKRRDFLRASGGAAAAMKPSAGEEFIRREYREGWRL